MFLALNTISCDGTKVGDGEPLCYTIDQLLLSGEKQAIEKSLCT